MMPAAENEYAHIGETCGCQDHDHDLVHELSKKLDALWRYDQYIANAEGGPAIQTMWRDFKTQCQQEVQRLKQAIADEIRQGCF
jgi:hypothetical protein